MPTEPFDASTRLSPAGEPRGPLGAAFADLVADAPPASFQARDIVWAARRRSADRRRSIVNGAIGVAVIVAAVTLGPKLIGSMTSGSATSANSAATGIAATSTAAASAHNYQGSVGSQGVVGQPQYEGGGDTGSETGPQVDESAPGMPAPNTSAAETSVTAATSGSSTADGCGIDLGPYLAVLGEQLPGRPFSGIWCSGVADTASASLYAAVSGGQSAPYSASATSSAASAPSTPRSTSTSADQAGLVVTISTSAGRGCPPFQRSGAVCLPVDGHPGVTFYEERAGDGSEGTTFLAVGTGDERGSISVVATGPDTALGVDRLAALVTALLAAR